MDSKHVRKPRIYHDLMKVDRDGRIKLVLQGTVDDLRKQNVVLKDGLELTFYSDDANDAGERDELRVDGTVQFNRDENCWVAKLHDESFRHASEEV